MDRVMGEHQFERTVTGIYDGDDFFAASVTERTVTSVHASADHGAIESRPSPEPTYVEVTTPSPKWKTITMIMVCLLNFCLFMSNICLITVWPKVISAAGDFEDARNLAIATVFFQIVLFLVMLPFACCISEDNHMCVAIFVILLMCLIAILNISAAATGMA